MAWLWLTLRIFGILLLGILALLVVLLFVPAKLQVRWNDDERFAEGRFLFLKYRYPLDFLNKKESAETEVSGTNLAKKPTQTSETPKRNDSPVKTVTHDLEPKQPESLSKRFKPPAALQAKRPFKPLKAPKPLKLFKLPRLKIPNPSKAVQRLTKLRSKLHHYLEIAVEGKPVLFRILKKIKIKRAQTKLHYSIDSPVHTAQLMGLMWASEANVHAFLRRHFKKVQHHDFDLKSDFTGNHLDVGLDYVITIRPIDLVVVALKSLTELKTIKKMLSNKPTAA